MAKVKIPKRVGGVKIDKKLRKKAKKAVKLAESPAIRALAASAMAAAAAGIGEKAARRRRCRSVAIECGDGPAAGARVTGEEAAAMAETIRAAALDGLRRFMEGFEEGLRKADRKDRDAPEAPSAS